MCNPDGDPLYVPTNKLGRRPVLQVMSYCIAQPRNSRVEVNIIQRFWLEESYQKSKCLHINKPWCQKDTWVIDGHPHRLKKRLDEVAIALSGRLPLDTKENYNIEANGPAFIRRNYRLRIDAINLKLES